MQEHFFTKTYLDFTHGMIKIMHGNGDKATIIQSEEYTLLILKEVKNFICEYYFIINTISQTFKSLRTHKGIEYNTYKECCLAMKLIQDDQEYDNCLQEATEHKFPSQIRNLFAQLLVYCNPTNPRALWEKYKVHMYEDYIHRYKDTRMPITEKEAEDLALQEIDEILSLYG